LIAGLEDSDDYTRFEAELRAEYAPASVLEQELVTRLASLSWRLRRLTAIETGLFQIQADALRSQASASSKLFDILYRGEPAVENAAAAVGDPTDLARCFLRVANFNKDALLLLGDCQKRTHAELAAIAMILGQRERPGFSRFSRRLTQTGQ
jgi:hypothetical protein